MTFWELKRKYNQNPLAYNNININLAHKKWERHCANAKFRGSSTHLSVDEYVNKIIEANILPEQIGKGVDKYQLSRYTDVGDYDKDSCRFITQKENLEEKKINGGVESAANKLRGRCKEKHEGVARQAAKMTGRVFSEESKAKIRANWKPHDMTNSTNCAISANKRPYSLISPVGVIYQGENLNQFCKDHGLTQSCAQAVNCGKQSHHKGWKKYVSI